MKRRSVIASVAGALAGPAWLAGCDPGPAGLGAGRSTLTHWPALPVLDLARQPTTLPATSRRARLINVWALWCPPCRRELPGLQRLALSLAQPLGQSLAQSLALSPAPRGVELCTLALADDSFAVREYLAQHAPGLQSVLLSPGSPAARQLGLDVLPQTFVVAADGRVLVRWSGERDWDSPAAREALDRLVRSG